jgi:hypothetical protein
MTASNALAALGLAAVVAVLPLSTVHADDGKAIVQTLQSGQELSGVVAAADDDTVRLTELSGMEYFDAVVRTERIEAVVLRRVTP